MNTSATLNTDNDKSLSSSTSSNSSCQAGPVQTRYSSRLKKPVRRLIEEI